MQTPLDRARAGFEAIAELAQPTGERDDKARLATIRTRAQIEALAIAGAVELDGINQARFAHVKGE